MEKFSNIVSGLKSKAEKAAKLIVPTAILMAQPLSGDSGAQASQGSSSALEKEKTEQIATAPENVGRNEMVSADTLRNEILVQYKDTVIKGKTEVLRDTVRQTTPITEAVIKESTPLAPASAEKASHTPESVVMNLDAFSKSFEEMIGASIKDKAELKNVKITKEGDHFVFKAQLAASGFDIGVSGKILEKNGMLDINEDDVEVKAFFAIKGKAEKAIMPALKTIIPKYKEYLEVGAGAPVDRISIVQGGVEVRYKDKS